MKPLLQLLSCILLFSLVACGPAASATPQATAVPRTEVTPIPPRPTATAFIPGPTPTTPAPFGRVSQVGKGEIRSLAVPAGGEEAVVVSDAGLAHYQASNLAEKETIPTSLPADLLLAPDGKHGARFNRDSQKIEIWEQGSAPSLLLPVENVGAALLAFSADSQYLVSVDALPTLPQTDSQRQGARLWKISDGSLVATLTMPLFPVTAVAVAPDHAHVATGHLDGSIHLWQTDKPETPLRLKGHIDTHNKNVTIPPVSRLVFSPDSKLLLSSGADTTLRIWQVADGKRLSLIQSQTRPALGMAYAPDQKTFATVDGGELIIRQTNGGKVLHRMQSFAEQVAYTSDSATLIAAGPDTLESWNVATGEKRAEVNTFTQRARHVAFSANGRVLASVGSYHIYLWNAGDGSLLKRIALIDRGEPQYLALSPDGSRVACGSVFAPLRVWNVADGKVLFNMKKQDLASVTSAAFAADNETAAVFTGYQTEVWNIRSSTQKRRLDGSATQLVFSEDGKKLVIAHGESLENCGGLTVFDLEKYQVLDELTGGCAALAVTTLPGGALQLTSASASHVYTSITGKTDNKEIKLGEAENRYLLSRPALSPDGTILADISHETLYVWSTADGKLLLAEPYPAATLLTFAPDGRLAIASQGGHIDIIQLNQP